MYQISITYNGNFLACSIEGNNSMENVIHYLNDIHNAMELHNCGKVMILENLKGPGLNLLKMYNVIRTAKKTILSEPHAVAYIDINPEHDHKNLRFAEMVAMNRFINIRFFTNEDDASKWLERITL